MEDVRYPVPTYPGPRPIVGLAPPQSPHLTLGENLTEPMILR